MTTDMPHPPPQPALVTPTRTWASQAALAGAVTVGLSASVALTMVLGRSLTPAAFAFVTLVGGVMAMARDATELGSGTVAAARIAASPVREPVILGELIGLRLVLAAFAAVGCLGLALRADHGHEQAVLAFAAASMLLLPFGALATVFQARHEPHYPMLIGLAMQLLAAAACIALVLLSKTAVTPQAAALATAAGILGASVAGVQVLREMATSGAIWRAGTRRLGWWPRPRWVSRGLMREIGGYGLASLCFGLAVQGSPVLVELAGPPGALEVYAAAFRPMVPLLTLPWVLATPLVPYLTALAQADRMEAAQRGAVLLRIGLGLGALVAVAGHDFAHAALAALYGNRFTHGAEDATLPLRWLSMGLAATIALAPATAILLARLCIRQIVALSGVCLVGTMVGAAFLLPQGGATGMAMAVAGATTVVALVAQAMVTQRSVAAICKLAAMLLPAIGLAVVNRVIPVDGLLLLVPGGIAFAAAAGIAVWLAGALGHRRAEILA